MNPYLIGQLVRLRYKLLWAKTRTRNGKMALFFAGYLLLVMALVISAGGGIGAGIVAVRSGKAYVLAGGLLGGLYVQALLAGVLLGFGVNTIFTESELRRYPLRMRERMVARHFLGMLDPFWFLILALELGLAVGLYLVGAGSLWAGVLAVLLLYVSNYLMARVLAQVVERLVSRKGGATLLLAFICGLGMLPAAVVPLLKKNPHAFTALAPLLSYSPPAAAAAAMVQPGFAAFSGFAVLGGWIAGLYFALAELERRPPRVKAVESTRLSFAGPWERIGALFGPHHGPLVAQWLRFYSRNNRFRMMYPLAVPLVAFLMFTQTRTAGSKHQFASLVGIFALNGFIGTIQFAVNQFGYTGGGFRRYLLSPVDPAAIFRTGSYSFLVLSAMLIPAGAILMAILSPVPLDVRGFVMLVGVAVTGLFGMHGAGLWTSILAARRGKFTDSFGNDLSFAGNVIVIGGILSLMFLPRVVSQLWPGVLDPRNWWAAILLAIVSVVFYFVSLRITAGLFRARRERLMAIVEGKQ
jgi:hypothetical protein